ncbi:serine protease inhibitor Cvsi-2-like [Mya arenaria]|uniref:serine protease inhibitor Cvsi-2-like n=1 Tax=Mya arenaria TaxID=6604 RepID=UPI0022E820B3|nr:serine protease inhibitor Cvsi-2-like [Mya arenaria]
MKFLALFLLVGAVIGCVLSEECHTLLSCDHLTCAGDWTLDCVQHECTCTHTNAASCITTADCPACTDGHEHCVDNKCRCGFRDHSQG